MSRQPASLPVANPTTSYWLSQKDGLLENIGSNATLPVHSDTVIIGSGISGAVIAHEILQRDPSAKIVMLEARNVCSGATGRNVYLCAGGHIKPDRYKSFEKYQSRYGTEAAKKLSNFEQENMIEFIKFIKDNEWAGDVDLVEATALLEQAGGNLEGFKKFGEQDAALRFRVKSAIGAISYPACSVWPRKIVLRILNRAVEDGLQIYTHTPVRRVSKSETGAGWDVETAKGKIVCNRVFHATNGYVSSLLPQFAGKVVPVKANAAAINPSTAYSSLPLEHTCGFQWATDFDYMIQRPTDGMPLIIGGCDLAHPHSLPGVIGDSDDSVITPEIQAALKAFPQTHLQGWGTETSVRQSWAGIMGFTAQEMPFIGEVPSHPGQFVVAGYSGHGMARSFLSSKALVQLSYSESLDPRVPSQYLDVKNRLEKTDSIWDELLNKADNAKSSFKLNVKL
ncbi:FAD dependent oxidoreductase [Fusarium globosum]|uniref:FAD dependent oxidoreductase n=1 Tax=Fusarium globosum TaxID=78864 RepID=A0A8H5XV58_9HYPO|nr:FAD dependent oxidoreductase [Fusarium globosum]